MNVTDRIAIDVVVAQLDAIDTADPKRAHSEADRIVLDSTHPDVRAAYQRVVDRSSWWVTA